MKKIVFIAAAAIVMLAGCKNNAGTADAANAGEQATENAASAQVAYIQLDSLLPHYDMYKDLSAEMEAKAKKVNSDLTARGNKFQREVNDFQEKVEKVLITRAQAAETEAALQKKQQDLMQYSQTAQAELAEEEVVMLNQIQHSITEFLKEFNSDKRYGMILSSTAAGPVFNADPSLDITAQVTAGLNKKYSETKTK